MSLSVLTVLSDTQCREEMMEDMSMISTHQSLMMNFVNGLRQSASFNRFLCIKSNMSFNFQYSYSVQLICRILIEAP